jgi:hypothetical protein
MFAMTHRWNRITASPSYALTAAVTETDSRDFFAGVGNYSTSLQARFARLHENNLPGVR